MTDIKGLKVVWMTLALPAISAISGSIYFGYDAIKRFEIVENNNGVYAEDIGGINDQLTAFQSRTQSLEQAMQDNDVRGLAPKLSEISTQMETILEQQKELLDLRSKVEKAQIITDGLDTQLDKYTTEIDDLWEAFDEAVKNPLK